MIDSINLAILSGSSSNMSFKFVILIQFDDDFPV